MYKCISGTATIIDEQKETLICDYTVILVINLIENNRLSTLFFNTQKMW